MDLQIIFLSERQQTNTKRKKKRKPGTYCMKILENAN